ncbi:MAG: DUF1343 domain-containing protein [Desulfobacterales bacterium]|nr:DUF1343 domain-containing protein [Desulfobacterales bacterium]
MAIKRVQIGLERFLASPPASTVGRRLGLLCNPASVDRRFRHARDLIHARHPGGLSALFSPQHGFFAEKQDNMIESDDRRDPVLGVPVFSLYGETRIPTREMFDHLDLLVIDLQDAGTRVYTFIYTMHYCLEAARRFDKKVIVLDRPNPVSGAMVEGNLVTPECASFVGLHPIPMRHGLTIGEIALLFNNVFGVGADLEVIPMKGWKREMFFRETGLPWIPPSPNLPTPDSAMVYPGQVVWEGTNVSEGRGTTRPFEYFGAPHLDPAGMLSALGGAPPPGCALRPVEFEPTWNKWKGRTCRGFQLHVTDRFAYRPYATTLKLLRAVIMNHRDRFQWKEPPYEYEFQRAPIDLILGDGEVRRRIERLDEIDDILASRAREVDDFVRMSREIQLYGP